MAIPKNTAPWSLEKAAQEVKNQVDRLVDECTKAKANLGTSYDEVVAIPAYIAGFSQLANFVNVDCGYDSDQVGVVLVTHYGSSLDWATDVKPSYDALKLSLPSVVGGILAKQADIGALLKIAPTGGRTFTGDAGAAVNDDLSALLDTVLINFES